MEILNSVNPAQINELLGDYGTPAEIVNTEVSTEKNETKDELPKPEGNTNLGVWQGNPLYFQSGKKAGQLKPSAGGQAKMRVIRDNDPVEIDGELITGALFLTLVDLLFPMLIASTHNFFTKEKKGKIDPNKLMLTEKQKNQLAPVADKVVKQIKLSANPTLVLLLTMGGLYGMQYAVARMESQLKAEK